MLIKVLLGEKNSSIFKVQSYHFYLAIQQSRKLIKTFQLLKSRNAGQMLMYFEKLS